MDGEQRVALNLVHDPWLRVLARNGRVEKLSLIQLFERAGSLHSPAYSNPMDRFSVYRFLLAIVAWVLGPPTPPAQNLTSAQLQQICETLEKDAALFDLFGERRFMQIRGEKKKASSVFYLFHEIPTGTNIAHFHHMHINREEKGVCPACAVVGLLRLPHFTTGRGSGFKYGLSGVPPIYQFPQKDTLVATLGQAWSGLPTENDWGKPFWVTPSNPSGNVPLLLGLTWPPRKVWFHIPQLRGVCMLCSNQAPLLTSMTLEPNRPTTDVDYSDPNAAKSGTKCVTAKQLVSSPELALSDLRESLTTNERSWIVRFATNQAKYYHCLEDTPEGTSQQELEKLRDPKERDKLLPHNWKKLRGTLLKSKQDSTTRALPKAISHLWQGTAVPSIAKIIRLELSAPLARARQNAPPLTDRVNEMGREYLLSLPYPYGKAWPRYALLWENSVHGWDPFSY